MARSYYDILGVAEDANEEAIEVMIKRLSGVLTCWVNGQHEGTYNGGVADMRDMRFIIEATGGHGSTVKDMRW